MSIHLFSDPTMQGLEYALNSLSLRQQVLSNNIANAQTPGYAAQDVSFESQLSNIFAGAATSGPGDAGTTTNSPDRTTRQDGNSVGMEAEMSKTTQTNILYDALSQLTADRLGILKAAING